MNIKSADNYSLFRIGARGKITSEAVASWDFENKQVKVGYNNSPANVTQESALNGFSGAKYQATVEVDLKEVGDTPLNLKKDGYRFLPVSITAETISADNLFGNGVVYLSDKDGPAVNIQYSTVLGKSRIANLTGEDFRIPSVGQDLGIRVDGNDSGTSGTLKIYIVGFFIFEEENNQEISFNG